MRTIDGSRIAAAEVLLASPRIKDLIHKGQVQDMKEAMEKGATIGMQTFDMHMFQLYYEGKISLEEALRNADSANNLRLRIKLAEDGSLETKTSAFSNGNGKKDESEEDSPERTSSIEDDFHLSLDS